MKVPAYNVNDRGDLIVIAEHKVNEPTRFWDLTFQNDGARLIFMATLDAYRGIARAFPEVRDRPTVRMIQALRSASEVLLRDPVDRKFNRNDTPKYKLGIRLAKLLIENEVKL